MQELPVPVDQGPNQTDAEKQDRWPRQCVPEPTLAQADGIPANIHYAQLPGLHGEGLTAAPPVPKEIHPEYAKDIYPEDAAGGRVLGTNAENQQWDHESQGKDA